MVVPGDLAAGAALMRRPPSTMTIDPKPSFSMGQLSKVNFEMEAIDGIASPRNPME